MADDWFDGYAGGDFLPGVSDALRAEIDAVGETVAYCQGYADGVGLAAAKVRDAEWRGWSEGFADACRALDEPTGPCVPRTPVRRRPMYGAGLRTGVRSQGGQP